MNNVRAEANRKKRTAKGKGKGVASPKSPRKVRGDERMPYLGGFYDGLEEPTIPKALNNPIISGLAEVFDGAAMIHILDQIDTIRKMNKAGQSIDAIVGVSWGFFETKFSTWLSSPPQSDKTIESYQSVSPYLPLIFFGLHRTISYRFFYNWSNPL